MLDSDEAELKGQLRFCDQLWNEIHGQEDKLKKKDGNVAVKVKEANKRCRLLTDPELIELYAQHQAEIEAKATEKEKKKDAREKHEEALKTWKVGEEERKRQCAQINANYHAALEAWKEEKELAKQEKRQARWTKPVRGPLPKAASKPKKVSEVMREVVGSESGEEFDEEAQDESE